MEVATLKSYLCAVVVGTSQIYPNVTEKKEENEEAGTTTANMKTSVEGEYVNDIARLENWTIRQGLKTVRENKDGTTVTEQDNKTHNQDNKTHNQQQRQSLSFAHNVSIGFVHIGYAGAAGENGVGVVTSGQERLSTLTDFWR